MSTEYAFQSTKIGEWDKNNKNPQAITSNNYLAAQNVLKRAEKYKAQEGRESLISLYRKNTKLALLPCQEQHSDTSLFWKLLLQTALPNNERLKYPASPFAFVSTKKHQAQYILFRVILSFLLSYSKILIFHGEKTLKITYLKKVIALATITLQ